ncbi:hypothetical protein MLD38_032772 [Melastoma candidum]|uniref:Uncharacterized protein n=1 Tax=Melastoma candidum TaxID=119954 RepID=A0ACB9M6G4_9MYRT|nr:hypothetical protein MLD38_032772 [Melastoma candidum]
MSSRRVFPCNPTQHEVNNLISKLLALLPQQRSDQRVPSSEILKDTCDYIRKLQKEIEELAERLIPTIENAEASYAQDIEVLIRNVLQN